MKLVEVGPQVVIVESGGARQELRLPARAVAAFGGAPPPPNFTREGNTLTAPSAGAAGGRAPNAPAGQLPQPPQPQQLPQPNPPPGAPAAQTQ
jgi:hypothetical protein